MGSGFQKNLGGMGGSDRLVGVKALTRYAGLKFICHFLSNLLPGKPLSLKVVKSLS